MSFRRDQNEEAVVIGIGIVLYLGFVTPACQVGHQTASVEKGDYVYLECTVSEEKDVINEQIVTVPEKVHIEKYVKPYADNTEVIMVGPIIFSYIIIITLAFFRAVGGMKIF